MSRLRLGPHIARSALAITLILVGLWLAGRLLGDGSWWTGLLYYIPTPVPIVACAAAAILLRRARPRHALLALVLTLMLTTHWASTEVRWTRSVDSAANTDLPTLRLVHWNVFRNFLPWQGKIERLRRLEADIYVLNELPRQVARGNWALKLGPGMDYAQGQLMMVACRGKVLSQKLEIDPETNNPYFS